MTDKDKDKLAAFYTSDTFQSLQRLIADEVQISRENRKSLGSIEETALNVAKSEGHEDLGLIILARIENYYKKLKE